MQGSVAREYLSSRADSSGGNGCFDGAKSGGEPGWLSRMAAVGVMKNNLKSTGPGIVTQRYFLYTLKRMLLSSCT
jgi:hypothetical protein